MICSIKRVFDQESYTLMLGLFKRKKVTLLKFNLDKHNYLVSTKIMRIVKDEKSVVSGIAHIV